MEHLTSSVKSSIATANWYAALGLSLALPDICGFLEAPTAGSQRRYVDWCNRFLVPKYTHLIGAERMRHVFLSGEDCYALRCAFLHEGADEIVRQRARKALDSFVFVAPPGGGGSMHCNQFGTKLQLQVDRFCMDVCDAVAEWRGVTAADADVARRASELLIVRDLRDGLRL